MKMRPQYGLDVSYSQSNYMRIAQDRGDGEHVILLSPSEARQLIAHLTAELHADSGWVADFEEAAHDD